MAMEEKNKLSLSNDLRSHPDRLLLCHLKNVGALSEEILKLKKLNLDGFIDSETLKKVSYIIGITHDFGKTTRFFQEYINEEDEKKKVKLKNKPETHHAFLSSIFAYYSVKQYLTEKRLVKKDYYKYLPIISFLIVKRHHGNLDNADNEIIDFDEDKQDILEKQINSIDFDKIKKIYDRISIFKINLENIRKKFGRTYKHNDFKRNISKPGVEVIQKEYLELIKDFKKDRKLIEYMDEEHTLFYYSITLLLYSILLDADKTDAANLEEVKRVDINENIVDKYKKLKFSSKEDENKKINDMRNEIYEEVLSNVQRLNLDKDKILSLNVPTGTGKTLTALSFALKLRKRIESEKGYKPRIIYSLPFLSIIDQNFAVFKDVFEMVDKEKPTSDILLKHHHLSDVVYTRKDDEFESVDKDVGKDLLLIEGWNSEIIVTTFIQFFYSVISSRNRAIRKFHNIINSIVILDEVQAIPHEYWLLLNRTIKFFAEYLNTYFIFITATQPLIFDETKKEIIPLVENKKDYFEKLDRVILDLDLKPKIIEDFEDILKKDLLENENKDFLIVLNTINSSKGLYKFICGLNIKNSNIYYLSTNIIPKKRLERITDIKKRTKKRKIIVSTQLIEAGVDIDVDVVYRDFAPLDSINQVAGRCNRNFGDKKGSVKIFILKEEKNGKIYYPHNIYGTFLPFQTENVFKEINKNKIKEKDFLKLNENYFEKVKMGKSDDKSKTILKNVEELKFQELSEFKLIQEVPYKVDVFVELDDESIKVRQEYENIQKIKDSLKRHEKWIKIKNKFHEYVISVDKRKIDSLPSLKEDEIWYISYDSKSDWYDEEIGFNPKNDASFDSRCV